MASARHRLALTSLGLVLSLVSPVHESSAQSGLLRDEEVAEIIAWASELEAAPLPYVMRHRASSVPNPVLGGVLTPRLRIAAWVRERLARNPSTPITPSAVPASLREPVVLVQFATLGIGPPSHPTEIGEAFPCGHETRVRLHPHDDVAALDRDAGVPPLWFRTEQVGQGSARPGRCLVTAAFTRADLERQALLHAEIRVEREDRVSFASSVIVRVGRDESRAWR